MSKGEVNAVHVKIGTLPSNMMPLIKRRPRGHFRPATRTAPDVGQVFYVRDRWGVALCLRCTSIKPDIGLIYAEKA